MKDAIKFKIGVTGNNKIIRVDMVIAVNKDIKAIIAICWEAIRLRHVLTFDFKSNSGNTGLREIKPYMVHINENNEIKVAGLPRHLWNKPPEDRKHARHYLLKKIDLKQITILSEGFTDPGVPRDIIVYTKTVKVICRFIYNDEDEGEVRKTWFKIEGLGLL